MGRNFIRAGWIRAGAVAGLALICAAALPLLRARAAHAQGRGHDHQFALASGPLLVGADQSAAIAFFTPTANRGGPAQYRLLLLDAEAWSILASKDIVLDRPGGGCLKLTDANVQVPAGTEVVGILIGLSRPEGPGPVASLQVFNPQTQGVLAALPAVQVPAVQLPATQPPGR